MRHSRLLLVLTMIMLVFAVSLPGGIQEGSATPPVVPPSKTADKDPQFDPRRNQESDTTFTPEQLKAMNKQRHEALKKDTDKLLELATELKMYVDKSNENTLSLDVVKKAETIEKLARSVKDKMKGM